MCFKQLTQVHIGKDTYVDLRKWNFIKVSMILQCDRMVTSAVE